MHATLSYIGLNWVTSPDTIKIARYMWNDPSLFLSEAITQPAPLYREPKHSIATVAETLLEKCAGQLSVV